MTNLSIHNVTSIRLDPARPLKTDDGVRFVSRTLRIIDKDGGRYNVTFFAEAGDFEALQLQGAGCNEEKS